MRFLRGFGVGEIMIVLFIIAIAIVMYVAHQYNEKWNSAHEPAQVEETSEVSR